jgi:hypothetical protein
VGERLRLLECVAGPERDVDVQPEPSRGLAEALQARVGQRFAKPQGDPATFGEAGAVPGVEVEHDERGLVQPSPYGRKGVQLDRPEIDRPQK